MGAATPAEHLRGRRRRDVRMSPRAPPEVKSSPSIHASAPMATESTVAVDFVARSPGSAAGMATNSTATVDFRDLAPAGCIEGDEIHRATRIPHRHGIRTQ